MPGINVWPTVAHGVNQTRLALTGESKEFDDNLRPVRSVGLSVR
jgi:hypothetical protein